MEYQKLDDLKYIKKDYGENMMKLCRSLFPTILERPGLLYHILSTHFVKSRFLYWDIVNESKEQLFKRYIYHFYDRKVGNGVETTKSVKELLDEAGYEIYECKTNKDIQRFKRYYAEGEELCTFRDPRRIDNHYIFFIVKKDIYKIRREDFVNPQREDSYGVSVLDLQFDKGDRQRVSIKSRYNHTVNNPDATYSNNLELIAPGLTDAFENDYGFNIGKENEIGFELYGYVQARDGKYYKYNHEFMNIHYCPNNIIIDNGLIIDKYKDKSRYTFMDFYILDEVEKKIIVYDQWLYDSFLDSYKTIKDIKITNKEGYKEILITNDKDEISIIKLDKAGNIIGYENEFLIGCGDFFLGFNRTLNEIKLPNLQRCGSWFLSDNRELKEISFPKLEECGDGFLKHSKNISEIELPSLKKCGIEFLEFNRELTKLSLPSLEECDENFLSYNIELNEVFLPNLKIARDWFLMSNGKLKEVELPKLEYCGNNFIEYNSIIKKISLPNLLECGKNFLSYNKRLINLSLPNLIKCGDHFLGKNHSLIRIYLPKCGVIGKFFLEKNLNVRITSVFLDTIERIFPHKNKEPTKEIKRR